MSSLTLLINAVVNYLAANGVDVRMGEMYTPGNGSYLYLAMLNVKIVNGVPEIVEVRTQLETEGGGLHAE